MSAGMAVSGLIPAGARDRRVLAVALLVFVLVVLICMIAVPVVLLGTFGVLAALGFSINMLTMFAMVLAIGLLVDDAIVEIENIMRHLRMGKTPYQAAMEAAEVPASPVYSVADMFRDAQFAARGMFEAATLPDGTPMHIPGIVPKLEATPGRTEWLGPKLGEHTDEILAGLGLAAGLLGVDE